LPPSSALRSEALTALAETVSQQGQTPLAVQLCNEALIEDRKRGPTEHDVLARTLDSLALVYLNAGTPEQAIAPMSEALELRRSIYGVHHARTAETMDSLGALYYDLGRYQDAAKMWSDVLRIDREIYGDVHVEVSTMLNNLGLSALMAGRLSEAEPMLRDALSMDEKLRSPTHNYLVDPLLSLAMIDLHNGKVETALAEITRAERIARMPDHGELLDRVLLQKADVELATGHREEAAALLIESRSLIEKAHPPGKEQGSAWRYAIWDLVNARRLAQDGKITEAKQILDNARGAIVQRFGPDGFYSLVARRRSDEIDQLSRRSGALAHVVKIRAEAPARK
jgi:tetratricopeptide (TPR) repeat protein